MLHVEPAPQYRMAAAPLIEAVGQVNFPIVPRLQTLEGVTPLQERLEDLLPYMNQQQVQQVEFAVGPAGPVGGSSSEASTMHVFTSDDGWTLRLSVGSATLFDASHSDRRKLAYRVRRRLEAGYILARCADLPPDAVVMMVGCRDAFHLDLLQDLGQPNRTLEVVEVDGNAARAAVDLSFTVHRGDVRSADRPAGSIDLALILRTLEYVDDPASTLQAIWRLLKPDGRIMILNDNTGSLDFRLFRNRHWGGYHFPRHRNLFNVRSLSRLSWDTGFDTQSVATIASPLHWMSSVRNCLYDVGASARLTDLLGRRPAVAVGPFAILDLISRIFGRGALLCVVARKRRV